MQKKLTHVSDSGNPKMVDVSSKKTTPREAIAEGEVFLGKEVSALLSGNELITKKGPVFQTAILAGVMASKKTHEIIPFCHLIGLEDCQISIQLINETAKIVATCRTTGKTGVEMESLMAVSAAALTVYDMCKAITQTMEVRNIRLVKKTGGKKNYQRKIAK